MKRLLIAFFGLLSAPLWALSVGEPLPSVSLLDGAGKAFSIPANKVVVIDVWASWCAPCKRALPFWESLQTKYGAQGLQVIALNVDRKRADADRFVAALPLKLTIAYDTEGAAAKQLGVVGMPTSFVLDSQQRVLLVHGGFKDSDKAELENKVLQALKGLKP